MISRQKYPSVVKHARTWRAPRSLNEQFIEDFLLSLDCARSLTVWLLFKNNEHSQLLDLKCDPLDYNCSTSFGSAYRATEFLSKSVFLKTHIDLNEAALKKFEEFELLCAETNRRFREPTCDELTSSSHTSLLFATKRIIEGILGDFSADEVFSNGGWGPGVSTTIRGSHTSAYNKFRNDNGITRDLYSLISPEIFSHAYPAWTYNLSRIYGEKLFDLQVGNKIVTVPKNAKTDRTIAIEPGINLWFQKSCGNMIRRRLLRVGIDLKNQWKKNRLLSKIASKTDDLATVDFSSASDSIAYELVQELLPRRWFVLLDACRSHVGCNADGSNRKWEKFSSMGNGFTFELESLIFYAAAVAVTTARRLNRNSVSIFGDDVIIPSICYDEFQSYSRFLGFIVNGKKSFSYSPFRESCGKHYWAGVDVTPLFHRREIRSVVDIYKAANAVRKLAHTSYVNMACDRSLLQCWRLLYQETPPQLRFKVPYDAGDVGFISNFDEATPPRLRDGHEGFSYIALTTESLKGTGSDQAFLIAQVWRLTDDVENQHPHPTYNSMRPDRSESRNLYELRGRSRLRVRRVAVQQWYNLGPWL